MAESVSATKRASKPTAQQPVPPPLSSEILLKLEIPSRPKLLPPGPYHPGTLISVTSLDVASIARILQFAADLESSSAKKRARQLEGRVAALLFYESSTRTRTSFELAAKQLGVTTTLVSDKSSSIEKGESLKDTGLTLRALGAECIILRHSSPGAPDMLARFTNLPVINAGDGSHEHPTQALLDLRTLLAHGFGGLRSFVGGIGETTLARKTIVIAGDILHSRVARSNALLLPKLGAHVVLCGPAALLPDIAAEMGPGISIERDFNAALRHANAVMMLRIQKERLAGLELDLDGYIDGYQLNQQRLAAFAPTALVMHPGPMIRGLEITAEVADGPQSVIEEQVRHGLAIRMAVLVRALGGKKQGSKKKKNKKGRK
jgi:aspartate carbamoyltransferase catalytic subunit